MSTPSPRRGLSRSIVATAVVLALGLGAVIGVLVTRNPPAAPQHARRPKPHYTLSIVSVTPSPDATEVSPATPVSVQFSTPMATKTAKPKLEPSTAGVWKVAGKVLTFEPTTPFLPLTRVTLTIPGGESGVRARDGATLKSPMTESFEIQNGSILRLQQLLSLLDYSPLLWTSTSGAIEATDAAGQAAALYDPPVGVFSWRETGWPARLLALWHPGQETLFTRGLIMSFQADHDLYPNGAISAGLWASLLTALTSNDLNTGGYNYALANKANPETLTIWHDGTVVLHGPANTGIPQSPTPDGTFPVNARLRSQVMHGTNPNGVKYADLVQFVAYFDGNDAVHYMPRADYGIPQSLGCVELPLAEAAQAWPYLAYGTLVSIIG